MTELDKHVLNPREVLKRKEDETVFYLPDFDVITITGFAGTGKTSLADMVTPVIVGTEFIKVGQNVRHEFKNMRKMSDEEDIVVDLEQEQRMRNSSGKPVIIEGRLSGIFAADINGSRMYRVLVIAEEPIRQQRLIKRRLKEDPGLTRRKIIREELDRDSEFVVKTQRLYPHLLQDKHPYDPTITNRNGQRVYNEIIDSSYLTQEETSQEFLKRMEERGWITKLSRGDFGEGIVGDNAYNLIKSGATCECANCGKLARFTVDSATSKSVYTSPVCSLEHAGKVENSIRSRLRKLGMNPKRVALGRMGFAPKNRQKDELGTFSLNPKI